MVMTCFSTSSLLATPPPCVSMLAFAALDDMLDVASTVGRFGRNSGVAGFVANRSSFLASFTFLSSSVFHFFFGANRPQHRFRRAVTGPSLDAAIQRSTRGRGRIHWPRVAAGHILGTGSGCAHQRRIPVVRVVRRPRLPSISSSSALHAKNGPKSTEPTSHSHPNSDAPGPGASVLAPPSLGPCPATPPLRMDESQSVVGVGRRAPFLPNPRKCARASLVVVPKELHTTLCPPSRLC